MYESTYYKLNGGIHEEWEGPPEPTGIQVFDDWNNKAMDWDNGIWILLGPAIYLAFCIALLVM